MYYQQGTVISSEVYMHRKREHRNKKKRCNDLFMKEEIENLPIENNTVYNRVNSFYVQH